MFVGLICDRVGRKTALVATTLLIVIGAILGTAAHGAHGSVNGLFWFLTYARGITGVGVGGEYPASSTSASEAANEKMIVKRGPGMSASSHSRSQTLNMYIFSVFIMVTNFVLVFGGLLAVAIFLIVLSAAGENHLQTVWRVCFGIGIVLPVTVFYFRMRMLSSKLYRRGAIKRKHKLQQLHHTTDLCISQTECLTGSHSRDIGGHLVAPVGLGSFMISSVPSL